MTYKDLGMTVHKHHFGPYSWLTNAPVIQLNEQKSPNRLKSYVVVYTICNVPTDLDFIADNGHADCGSVAMTRSSVILSVL